MGTAENADSLLAHALRLTTAIESLAVLAAHLRAREEGLALEPAVAARLAAIAALLGVPDGSAQERQAVIGMTRSFFRQALELIESPARAPGWTYDDPVVLQAQGRASASIADALHAVAPQLGDLHARLSGEGGAFLDIGTGTAWLAMRLARLYPNARVTGLDVWPPALALATANVEAAGLAGRVAINQADAAALSDEAAFDAAWIPAPFIARPVVERVLARVKTALRPGGWAVLGVYGDSGAPLARALAELRMVRSGGHPWTPAEATEALAAHGFTEIGVAEQTVAPLARLVVGRA